MERRKAITAAAAASLTLLAGATGIALNSNIVGAGANDSVGQLSPVRATAPSDTISVRGQSASTRPTVTSPPVQRSDADPTTTSSASGHRDDEREHDDDRVGREHTSDHEYEGHDDDD